MANSASQIRKANLIFHSLNNTFYILEKRYITNNIDHKAQMNKNSVAQYFA